MTITNYRGVRIDVVVDHSRDDLLTEFGKTTLSDRYLMPGESYQDMFARVAGYYADDSIVAQRLYDAMSRLWFMPATPILSNGGTDRGLPISCFLNAVEDSIEGIRDTWAENVMLAARGGGIGTYWGGVRSIGEGIADLGETSGIIPFIKVQDSLTLAISQGSLRRGSSAVYLDIRHPEIEEFLEIRKPTGGDFRRKALDIHHGVMIDDEFMVAVRDGLEIELRSPKDGSVRKVVKARDIWMKLLQVRVETGEPYVVFSDTVNRKRPEVYKRNGLSVRQSNLCSEIALHTGLDHHGHERTAVCCLSSFNVFKADEWFGDEQFVRDVLIFLDNVLTDFINKTDGVPGFEKARYSAMRERSIGAGMMGFVSYLQSKGIIYESAIAQAQNIRLWKWLRLTGDKINAEVAGERGSCPDAIDAGLVQRWSHMFAVAPTASISIICGTISPGLEHFAANIFTQKTLSGSFLVRNPVLDDRLDWYADQTFDHFLEDGADLLAQTKAGWKADVWKSIEANEGSVQHLPFMTAHDKEVFRTFEEADMVWAIEHAAKRAPFIDQMASNNVFLPGDVHKRDLHNLHMKAWRDGVPSLYYVRSKSLQRASNPTHLAGEMPQPSAAHEVVLVDRGPAIGPLNDDSRYEACLACQ